METVEKKLEKDKLFNLSKQLHIEEIKLKVNRGGVVKQSPVIPPSNLLDSIIIDIL